NGPDRTGTLTADEVVRIWDVGVLAGDNCAFQIRPFGASMKLAVFSNPTSGLYWTNRSSAVLETGGLGTYTPPADGFLGAAVIKDDASTGSYLIRCGRCSTPDTLRSQSPFGPSTGQRYYTFQQVDTCWSAVGVNASGVDYDIEQYGAANGASWPDCFGSP